jgi:hypothetical protein
MNDIEAYDYYKHLRHWYNKLWLSEQLGYDCGPAGVSPKTSGYYIIRPIINLSGMGVGAKKIWIGAGDNTKTPPGYFWCEWFEGRQFSVTYQWEETRWNPISCWEGFKEEHDLSKFSKWLRTDFYPPIGDMFNELSEISKINMEYIEDNIIEVHLRTSPDPDYNELFPIWKDQEQMVDIYKKMGYDYIIGYEDADGFLETGRLGFMVKNF